MRTDVIRWFAGILAGVFLLVANGANAQTFPKFTGLVVDAANVLSPQTEADLTAKLEALQRDTKRQLVVATIPDMQGYSLEEYGYRLGRAWGVGLGDVDNGAILLIAPNEPAGRRGPRLEVGRGLESVLTDAFASVMIREQMVPRLRTNDVDGAMVAGTDAVIGQLRASPEEAQARVDAAVARFDKTHHHTDQRSGGIPIAMIFWLVVLGGVVLPMFLRRRGDGQRYRGDGGSGGTLPIVLWTIANEIGRSGGSWGDGSGGSSGSGSSGDGWGDGGFSGGGGGDFGGGGASGDW